MSFRQKIQSRPRTEHARVAFDHGDGNVTALTIVRATQADRKAVIGDAIRAGAMDPETYKPTGVTESLSIAAHTLSRLLFDGPKRAFGDSPEELEELMGLDEFDEWSALAAEAFAGELVADSKKPSPPPTEPSEG